MTVASCLQPAKLGHAPLKKFEIHILNCFIFVSAPECRDIETALYDRTSVRTYVFSELCSIFQYVIKRWLHELQLSGSRKNEVIMVSHEYTYQDHEYIIRTTREHAGHLWGERERVVSVGH